jgi:hypothetical protein
MNSGSLVFINRERCTMKESNQPGLEESEFLMKLQRPTLTGASDAKIGTRIPVENMREGAIGEIPPGRTPSDSPPRAGAKRDARS